jgi:hypothetical protein
VSGSSSGATPGTGSSGGAAQCVAQNGLCATSTECCSNNCQTNPQASNYLTCL